MTESPHLTILLLVACLIVSGCGSKQSMRPLKSAQGFTQKGIASWYGNEFHGRKTASGAIFDENALTCAHRILPFGSRIRVHNLENNTSCVLTVTDRGPFKKNRILDVSKAAAKRLKMLKTGQALVFIENIDAADQDGFYIQLGAFSDRNQADKLVQTLTDLGISSRTVQKNPTLHAVQAGPWTDQEQLNKQLAFFKQIYPEAFFVPN